jgi:hypothetical protein
MAVVCVTAALFTCESLSQNTRVSWYAFDAGFAVGSSTSNLEAKSAAGQSFVGVTEGPSSRVEVGFMVNPLLRSAVIGVDDRKELPRVYALKQNFPNPFNPTTTIGFDLPLSSHVVIKVYNILGQEITKLLDEQKEAGCYSVVWNGTNDEGLHVSSGVYFYRINADGAGRVFVDLKKMVYMK